MNLNEISAPYINYGKIDGERGVSLRNRGEWSNTSEYLCDGQYIDVTTHHGSLWICSATNTGQEPSEGSEVWRLAAKGINVGADLAQNTVSFEDAGSRTNIATGETMGTLFGKVKKWFSDLGTAAFQGVSNSLTQTSSGYVADARTVNSLSARVGELNNLATSAKGNIVAAINENQAAISTLNSSLAQKYKQIWSGEWSSGTITVPELRNYTLYALKLDAVAHTILCTRNGSAFRGGSSILNGNAALVYGITLSVSQNDLSFTSAGFYSLVSNKITNCAITAIIGVI